jgi:hypothetical protein
MRGKFFPFALALAAALGASIPAAAQDTFRWVDFHTEPAGSAGNANGNASPAGGAGNTEQDQDIVVWVTRALAGEKWTAIREIGVQYDAALVVTTERSAPDASPDSDTFHIWSVSLKNHLLTSILTGVNLRWLDPMQFAPGAPRELTVLYDDCRECAATTYFTALRYDATQHSFAARWMRGAQAVPVWTAAAPPGVALTQVYAVLAEPDGGEFLGTWSHFDFGKQKPAEDYVYRYDRDPFRGLERTQILTGKNAEAIKDRLCAAQAGNTGLSASTGLTRGQDSALCQQRVHPHAERKPVTTPPANNQGRSVPYNSPPRRN